MDIPESLRVLCICGNSSLIGLLREILERTGHAVDQASDARHGLSAFQSGHYHAVIVDHDESETNASDLAELLACGTGRHSSVIWLGHSLPAQAIGALKRGTLEFVRKQGLSVDPELVLALVQRSVTRSVSERRNRQDRIAFRDPQLLYRTLVETMNDGLAVVDQEGIIVYANNRLAEMTGYSRGEIRGRSVMSFFEGYDLSVLMNQFAQRRDGADQASYQATVTGKDRRKIPVIISSRSLHRPDGIYKGSFAVVTDITAWKRAEQDLRRAKDDLERRVQERSAELVRANEALKREIEHRVLTENALRESEERYRQMFLGIGAAQLLVDPDRGKIEDANPAAAEFYGHPVEQLKRMNIADLAASEEDLARESDHLTPLDESNVLACYHKRASGDVRAVEIHATLIRISGRDLVHSIVHDITDRKRIEQKLQLTAKIIQSSNEAVIVTDTTAKIVDVNPAFERLTGYSKQEVLGVNPSIMKSDRHTPEFYHRMWDVLIRTGHWQGEIWDRRKNGEAFPKLLSISAVRDEKGELTNYVGLFTDITAIKEAEERLARLAHYDPLTSLPNRLLFQDRLEQSMAQADRSGKGVGLLFLDLDGFKAINDSMGHLAGDELLAAVAERLAMSVRKGDTCARLGGDEFMLILPELAGAQNAASVARKIVDRVSQPFLVKEHEIRITVTVGISLYPVDAVAPDQLVQNADAAMYYGKQEGKNTYRFFSPHMNHKTIPRRETQSRPH